MTMKKQNLFLAVCSLLVSGLIASAQPARQYITVVAEPDHADWIYRRGEKATFTLYALKENARMPLTEIEYSFGPEKLPAEKSGRVTTGKDGFAKITIPGRKEPGFTTVSVKVSHDRKTYSGQTNIGFDPYSIRPTTTLPEDFSAFWEKEKAAAAKVPMLVRERYCPEESDDRVDVYYVRIQSWREGNYVYGVLTVPKTPGPKPAILRLPGAAVRSFSGPNPLAYEGFVVLEIGVHGIPVDQNPEMHRQLERGYRHLLDGYADADYRRPGIFDGRRALLGDGYRRIQRYGQVPGCRIARRVAGTPDALAPVRRLRAHLPHPRPVAPPRALEHSGTRLQGLP